MNNQMEQNNNMQSDISVQPVQPVASVPPIAPVQPSVTAQPINPMQPELSVQPINPMQPAKVKTNGLCIAAIIFAFLIPLVGLILGIIGIGSSKKNGEKGKGLAISAIIISILMPIVLVIAFFGLIVGIVNGGSDAAEALQEGCAEVDSNGNYVSRDGSVVCSNFKCTYSDNGLKLSSTCNLINVDDDYEADNDDYYEDDEVEQENQTNDEVVANFVANTSWILSDSSEIIFKSNEFEWYKNENVYTDNYYKGKYSVYTGSKAVDYITVDLSSYGVTRVELENVFARNEEYNEENFMVLVLNNESVTLNGVEQVVSTVTPYYGFILRDGTFLDLANMNTGSYSSFSKKTA